MKLQWVRRAVSRVRCAQHALRASAVIVAVVGTTLVMSGCQAPPQPNGLRVVATTTQVTDFTKQVVGNGGTVDGIIAPNQTAHSFDPSAKVLLEMAHAQALVINGAGIEPWLTDAIDASGFHGVIIDASKDVSVINHDPHIWTSIENARVMVKTIARGLSMVDSSHATSFETNAARYGSQLEKLQIWAQKDLAQIPADRRLLVTNHDGLAYFVKEMGITFVGSIIPSFDDNAEPSAAEIDQLVARIRTSGARAVFSETSISSKLATTIATEAGVRVYFGPDALYADTLGPVGSSGSTYMTATEHNVRVLVDAWGGTNLPLSQGPSS